MNKLTTRLFRDGLMLNTGKTQIKSTHVENRNDDEEKQDEHAEAVLKSITKLTGGYNRIARRFIMPAAGKHEAFTKINLEEEMRLLSSQAIVDFSGIQKIAIAALVQKRFELLIEIAKICTNYLYGLDYFIDMLIKNSDFIPEIERNRLSDMYSEMINSGDLYSFEWHCASVAKLLSHPSYFRKNALLTIYKSAAKDVSTYASMIALEGLKDRLTRSEFKTIREYFDRCDDWEKRRLLLLSEALPTEERKAWIKAVKSTITSDFLASKLCETITR